MPRAPKRTRRFAVTLSVTALAIDANFDLLTQLVYDYRQQHVYPYLAAKGVGVDRCQGVSARRAHVAPEAVKPNVTYVTGSGHGSADTFFGDQWDPIFRVGAYAAQEAAGKIVHLLSCNTAHALAPDLVSRGCLACFSFDNPFTFPLESADLFLDCESEIDRAVADGCTAQQVYDRVVAKYNQNIAAMNAAGKPDLAAYLETHRDHLCAPSTKACFGDPGAKLP